MRELLPGERVDHFRIVRKMGSDATTIRYEAQHEGIAQPVVMLRVLNEGGDQKQFELEAFLHAKRGASPRMFDMGRTADGTMYTVHEFIPELH